MARRVLKLAKNYNSRDSRTERTLVRLRLGAEGFAKIRGFPRDPTLRRLQGNATRAALASPDCMTLSTWMGLANAGSHDHAMVRLVGPCSFVGAGSGVITVLNTHVMNRGDMACATVSPWGGVDTSGLLIGRLGPPAWGPRLARSSAACLRWCSRGIGFWCSGSSAPLRARVAAWSGMARWSPRTSFDHGLWDGSEPGRRSADRLV